MRRARLAGILLLSALLGPGVDASPDDAEPILHEYVAPPDDGGGSRVVDPAADAPRVIGGEVAAGRNPAAIRNGARLLPEPPKTELPGYDEPTFGRRGFGADRETSASLDLSTGADSTLHYTEVFNPSVVPWKRMSALDSVRRDFTLGLHDDGLTDLAVGGAAASDRDLFWGSIVVDLSPGRPVPIPSVAPDMRILSYEAQPATALVFSRDGADNYYVRADAGAGGTHRLVFLADAPAAYFGATVPRRPLADAARGPLRPVPAEVAEVAERMLAHIGVSRSQPLDVAVNRLVAYFRAFQAGEPPESTGNMYRDLTLARRGVCRHRAFAFAITASTLGIPARYVTNEAHAFAEIWVPDLGWLRVDLGGAASELEMANAGDKSIHRPRQPDAFPRPPEYANGATRVRGDIGDARGLSGGLRADGGGDADPAATPSTDPLAPPSLAPGTGLPTLPPEAFQDKAPVALAVGRVDAVGFRGESVQIAGALTSGATGVGGLPVDLYLAPVGGHGGQARLVGRTVTEPDGSFRATVELPRDLALGEHELYAATPGDKRHAPALSP